MDDRTRQLLQEIAGYFTSKSQRAYLVGGAVRNLLLDQPCNDWDIASSGETHTLACMLANRLGGYYARLNEKASRVVVKQEHQETIIDIAPLKGGSIEEDLRQRDFTINAIAIPLSSIAHVLAAREAPGGLVDDEAGLLDPFNGLADIRAQCLRAVDDHVFRNDPLRMLRAVRLRTRYGLSIDERTEGLIRRDAALLPNVAPERIHSELYAILKPRGATARLRYLDTLDLFTVLLPEFIPARGMHQPEPHYWDVFEHSLETVSALEELAAHLQSGESLPLKDPESSIDDLAEIVMLLREAEQQGIFQFSTFVAPAMKMAALLHDIGKPVTYSVDEDGDTHFYNHPQAGVPLAQEIMTRLSASMQDRRLVQLVVAHHMRPGQLAQVEVLTARAIRRYFVDLGPNGIYVALFSLADHLATPGPRWQQLSVLPEGSWQRHVALVRLLLTRYIRERHNILPPRLISAEELMRRLKLEPGPMVGRLLDEIAEAQAEGFVSSKEEALWLAEEKLRHHS